MVISKLQGGADLMIPGLAGPPFPAGAKKDAVVAIANLDNPSVPLVVGVCEIDIASLKKAQGEKGHAVQTVHWFGDELWDWSTSGKAGNAAPESIQGWIHENNEPFADEMDDLGLDEAGDGGVPLHEESSAPQANSGKNKELTSGEDAIAEIVDIAEAAGEMSQQGEARRSKVSELRLTRWTTDIDRAFRQAFLYGVHEQEVANDPPKYGMVFPITQSFVMSALVLPFLPSFTVKETEALVIKKSSWKTVRKFIKSLDKEKLLLCKDRPGNEVDILDIDFEDRQIRDFVPYRLPQRDNGGGTTKAAANADDDKDESIGQKIKKVEVFRPKDSIAPLFRSADTRYVAIVKNRRITWDRLRKHTAREADPLLRGQSQIAVHVDRYSIDCDDIHRSGKSGVGQQ